MHPGIKGRKTNHGKVYDLDEADVVDKLPGLILGAEGEVTCSLGDLLEDTGVDPLGPTASHLLGGAETTLPLDNNVPVLEEANEDRYEGGADSLVNERLDSEGVRLSFKGLGHIEHGENDCILLLGIVPVNCSEYLVDKL